MSKKKPRFFCDNCGYEVGHEVKNCPYCGRTFASVRCPSCGYSGPDRMFLNGCPLCGYSASPNQKSAKIYQERPKKNYIYREHPLPFIYIAAGIVLFALVAILSWFITR